MWSSGWLIGLGLWMAALAPRHQVAAMHVTMLGGFGVLTMAIASRVVVTHGGHGPAQENRLVTPVTALLLAAALCTRLVAEFDTSRQVPWLAASASAWMIAWLSWLWSAGPFLRPRQTLQNS
jgi:uncharacterized protein involved in response to NO